MKQAPPLGDRFGWQVGRRSHRLRVTGWDRDGRRPIIRTHRAPAQCERGERHNRAESLLVCLFHVHLQCLTLREGLGLGSFDKYVHLLAHEQWQGVILDPVNNLQHAGIHPLGAVAGE